jgi:penicillin-binding protein 2
VQSQYAPGSIFKIVLTAAGLQERTLTPFDRTYCTGEFQLGTGTFKDWKVEGHGEVNLKEAMVQSCNVFFYEAGLKVGGSAMTRYARAFGFGELTGIELPGERVGLIPRPRLRRGREMWMPGDVVNMSIGQGQLLVTPLQVATFMSTLANGGVRWKPRLVQRVERPGEGLLWSDSGKVTGHVELSPLVWGFLRRSLVAAVRDGTGASAGIPGLEIAGKTGTAQTIAHSRAERGQDHAWFVGFAPAHDPEVVVVVLVERGGRGGQVAAPVVRRIFNAIFFEKVAWLGISG